MFRAIDTRLANDSFKGGIAKPRRSGLQDPPSHHFFRKGDVGTWRQVTTESLVAAIELALNATQEEREAIGAAASAAAHAFPWTRAAEATMEMLREETILAE